MAAKVQVTRPTKIELARLKRRYRLATRIQKIVKDRLSILVMEFLETVKECAIVKERQVAEFNEAYRALSMTNGYLGSEELEKDLFAVEMPLKMVGKTRNVAGVRIPLFEVERDEAVALKTAVRPGMTAVEEDTITVARRCLESIIELAELENSLELLGSEINKVKRINNALEYIVIPGLNATIRYLNMKFEERDREENARLKYVKLLIEKREAYAY